MWRWIILPVVLAGLFVPGCAFIKPTTRLAGPGWEFVDTKDNDIQIKNAKFDPETKGFSVEDLIVANKSSPVIEANVKQMLAFAEQQRAFNEGLQVAMTGLANIVNELVPALGMLRTQTSSTTELQTLIGTLRRQLETVPIVPTTQPGG